MTDETEQCSRCGNLYGVCTPYTCNTACAQCGHTGDVHRTWYVHLGEPEFCRRCPADKAYWHNYVPIPATDARQHPAQPRVVPETPGDGELTQEW